MTLRECQSVNLVILLLPPYKQVVIGNCKHYESFVISQVFAVIHDKNPVHNKALKYCACLHVGAVQC